MLNGKISILIVDTAIDFGGSIVSTANLIRGIDRSRFEPTFVSSTTEELVRSKLFEVNSITKVVIANKVLHYGRIGRLFEIIRLLPLRPIRKAAIYLLYVVRMVVNIPYAMKIAWLIHSRKVDLVQLNNGFGNDEIEILCLLTRRPRVVFFRGYVPLSIIERKLFLSGVKGYVSVSEFAKKEAIADGVPSDKILVATPPAIAEPFDEELRAAVRRRYDIPDGQLVFGIFGRIVNWKGQKEFVRAAAIVMRSFPDLTAVIVGDTSDGDKSYFEELKVLVRELGIEDRVVFTGYINKVYDLYSIMDVVAHTSVEPEPSGRVIFESMSCGIPVVASCLGGPKEFIDDGVDGYICDPRDTEVLAQRLGALLGDAGLRRTMGVKAQAKVAKLYNKDVYARMVEGVYLNSLGITP